MQSTLNATLPAIDAPEVAKQAAVEKQEYRDAMACLGSAVNIITTDGPGGRAGFTASAVCSVTDAPPTLLVCLNRSASVHQAFTQNQVLCVNTLADCHESLSGLFGGKRRWSSALPPPNGQVLPPVHRSSPTRWCRLTAPLRRSPASAPTIFCFVKSLHSNATMTATDWRISIDAIIR